MDSSQPVIVGQILGAHGLSGALRVKVFSDVAHRFDVSQVLYVRGDPYQITSSTRASAGAVILKFYGIESVDAAHALNGEPVTIPQDAVPPPPDGEYFHFQLLGLRVVTDDGEELGRVSEILETGSNDVYVVSGESGELLLPALAEVVKRVQLDEGVMVVQLPEGLR